jgi:hypothetical protein
MMRITPRSLQEWFWTSKCIPFLPSSPDTILAPVGRGRTPFYLRSDQTRRFQRGMFKAHLPGGDAADGKPLNTDFGRSFDHAARARPAGPGRAFAQSPAFSTVQCWGKRRGDNHATPASFIMSAIAS